MQGISKKNKPSYINYKDGGMLLARTTIETDIVGWRAETYNIQLNRDGLLILEDGYTWDYGTGAIDTRAVREASLVHDPLCELIEMGLLPTCYRATVDKEYRKQLKLSGMWLPRRLWQYYGIRLYVRLIKPVTG